MEIKVMQVGDKKIKLSYRLHDCLCGKYKDSVFKNLLELINAFSKVTILQGQFNQLNF